MKRTAAPVMALLATVFVFITPASTSAAQVHHVRAVVPRVGPFNYVEVCDPANLCLRDPSDGGAGTPVKMAAFSANPPNSMRWETVHDTSACNGSGKVESGCGIPDFFVDRYGNDPIEYLQQFTSGNCIKFSSDTSWFGYMGTCGDNVTLMTIASCPSPGGFCYVPLIAASEFFGIVQWMCGGSSVDSQPYAGSCPGGSTTWDIFP